MISNKVKISLIAICAVLIVSVFIINVTERVNSNKDPLLDSVVKHTDESGITRSYMAKMVSLLEYSKDELRLLDTTVEFDDVKSDEWFYTYVNGLSSMNVCEILIGKSTSFEPERRVTYGELGQIVIKLAEHIDSNEVKKAMPALWKEDADKEVEWDTFLSAYNYLINQVYGKSDTSPLKESMKTKELYVVGTQENKESFSEVETITDSGTFTNDGVDMEPFMDTMIKVAVRDDEILYVKELITKEVTLANVYITGQDGKKLKLYVNGIEREFEMNNEIDEDVTKKVADVVISNKLVKSINLKPETIRAKVLVAKDDYIELEKYGKLPVDQNFKVYKVYDKIAMEMTNDLLVGYDNADFVLCDGKICAALITKEIKAKNIRVILNTTSYRGLYHSKVKVTSDSKFTITYGDNKKTFKAGSEVEITKKSSYLKKGRLSIEPEDKDGRIKILTIERGQGNPSYRGKIEVASTDSGLTIVNEVSLEEYLYSVIPSEMPTSYGLEALKVQAICARSYAYNHLVANSCSKYGAHVDDSTTYQVYNNHEEDDLSVQAVKDTYGQVLQYNNSVIFAYYFSTSCGTTADISAVWLGSDESEYLQGKFQGSDKSAEQNYSDEKKFYSFIKSTKEDAYEKDYPWYRWNVTISFSDLKRMVDRRLLALYKKESSYVLTKDTDGVYKKISINTVGDIKDINISKRDSSGLATELIIKGSKNTVKIKSESFIRQLLGPTYSTIVRQDKSEVENLTLLPSAFIVFDKVKKESKITGVKISGGGYGHGVGMSQNGVKALVDLGKNYVDILKYYYTGIEIGRIY
ncbi:MAG: SpoIID/LytB domain-containing protein [bacterium]|nr:SpoIID/LytB domain-containing protein [bacterium]